MRRLFVILALLFGAGPAFAQWLANPGPVKPVHKVVRHQHRRVHERAAPPRQAASRPAPPHNVAHKAAAVPHKQVPLPARAPGKPAEAAAPAALPKPAPEPNKPAEAERSKAEAQGSAAASKAFAGVPTKERLKIQSALFWHGDYPKDETGEARAEAAIKSFQKRNKDRVTGVLTEDQRKELVEADNRYRERYGWRVVVDPATGIRIGLPTKLVPNVYDAPYGTRWSSPHGTVKVETFRIKGPNTDLAKLFEEAKKHPRDRQVETSVLHEDGFFVSGMQGLKDFAVRAKMRDGEVRGFTVLYDQMMETIVEPVLVAMASAFSPFPERPAPFADLAKRVEYGTGLIVSADGDILTTRKVGHDCEVIVADGLGNAARLAEDDHDGLTLLRVYGKAGLPALSLPSAAPQADAITLVGYPDPKEENGRKELIDFKARLAGADAIVPSQPVPLSGFAGAAALDSKGEFLGVLETRNYELASMQPSVPPVRLIDAGAIRGFLAKHHVAADGTAGARAAAVRIICVRK